MIELESLPIEDILLADLKPHPRNYKDHPEDQLAHIMESIREHGIYRNIIIARDNTILAGHGVHKAATRMGILSAPCRRLDLDPSEPRALKVLAGDNEIAHLGVVDDRALTAILKQIKDEDPEGLLGTGYDAMMLANLVFVTRSEGEIADHNEAAEWVGMPDYDAGDRPLKVVISFRNQADRSEFSRILGLGLTEKSRSAWWPVRENEDVSSLKYQG